MMLALLVAAGGCVWVLQFYQTHVMPRVQAAGEPVGLATRAELKQAVAQAASELQIRLRADGVTKQPPLRRLGVTVDIAATVNKAFTARRLADLPAGLALWEPRRVPLQVSVDQDKLAAYIAAAFPDVYKAPEAPSLTFSPESGQFELVPGTPGRGFNIAAIAKQIQDQVAQPGVIVVTASDAPVAPAVGRAAAVYAQSEANQRLWLRLEFLYDQKLVYLAEPPQIAAWMEFVPDTAAGSLDIRYDRERMQTFLRRQVQPSLNRFFGPGASALHSSEAPLKLVNTAALIDDMIYALRTKQSMAKEVEAVRYDLLPGAGQ